MKWMYCIFQHSNDEKVNIIRGIKKKGESRDAYLTFNNLLLSLEFYQFIFVLILVNYME